MRITQKSLWPRILGTVDKPSLWLPWPNATQFLANKIDIGNGRSRYQSDINLDLFALIGRAMFQLSQQHITRIHPSAINRVYQKHTTNQNRHEVMGIHQLPIHAEGLITFLHITLSCTNLPIEATKFNQCHISVF